MKKFVEHIKKEVKQLYEKCPQKPMTELTDTLKREHEATKKCHVCLKEFNDPQNKKVRDHCHYTSLYWGTAHNNCNLKYWILGYIPIVFHNFRGYNAQLFIKELGRRFKRKDIGVVPENKEKYISFNLNLKLNWQG